jgi:hypothetical protein
MRQAGQQVLRFGQHQPSQAEHGEAPILLNLAKDGSMITSRRA